MNESKIVLIYDKECPVCKNYTQMVQIRKSIGEMRLINARDNSEEVREVLEQGFDLDQGMVLKIDDNLYYGADAMHTIALLGSRSGVFNKINYWMFRSKRFSHTIYPVLKYGRAVLLKLLGKKLINT